MDGGGDLAKGRGDLVEATLLTGKRSLVPGIRGSGNVGAPGSIDARELAPASPVITARTNGSARLGSKG